MATFLDDIKDLTENIISESSQWYKEQIKDLYNRNQDKLFKKTTLPKIGGMYLFSYDPKLKEILPFYDMHPLVVPLEYYNDGFLGLNLHYLPPLARSALLDRLIIISNNAKYDDNTKLRVSYSILSNVAKNTNFKVCVKRYLYGHVRSSFYEVTPNDWKKVVVMPLQRWKVNSNQKYAGSPPY
jgi:hypothetical protein